MPKGLRNNYFPNKKKYRRKIGNLQQVSKAIEQLFVNNISYSNHFNRDKLFTKINTSDTFEIKRTDCSPIRAQKKPRQVTPFSF